MFLLNWPNLTDVTDESAPHTTNAYFSFNFYPHNVVSAVYATATWLAGWLAGWVYVRHTSVLYQNG